MISLAQISSIKPNLIGSHILIHADLFDPEENPQTPNPIMPTLVVGLIVAHNVSVPENKL